MAKGIKGIDWVLKVVLAIVYDIYGILRRITSGKTVPMVVGVLQIFTGSFFGILWLVDLITVITKKDVTVLI